MAAPKLSFTLTAAAALMFGSACRRAPAAAPTATPDLAPPAPSSSLIITPLDKAATGYTNEMQAASLGAQTEKLGIDNIIREDRGSSSPAHAAIAAPAPPEKNGKRRAAERKAHLARVRKLRLEYTQMRRNMDAADDKSVALAGTTIDVVPGRESGRAIEVAVDSPGVWSGAYGGAVEAGERVIENSAAWAELWGRLSRTAPPAIDFSKERVAALFAGPRPTPGYRARLIDVIGGEERHLLRWYEEGPSPDEQVGEGATAPFLLVSVPKDDKPIRCEKIRRAPSNPRLR